MDELQRAFAVGASERGDDAEVRLGVDEIPAGGGKAGDGTEPQEGREATRYLYLTVGSPEVEECQGRVALAVRRRQHDVFDVGVALCSPRDQYVKARGRQIAEKRLNKGAAVDTREGQRKYFARVIVEDPEARRSDLHVEVASVVREYLESASDFVVERYAPLVDGSGPFIGAKPVFLRRADGTLVTRPRLPKWARRPWYLGGREV